MSFPRYPTYKDSGVEWLGQVPEHWEVSPIKRLIQKVESGTSVNASDEPAEDGKYGVLKTSCVYTGTFDPDENKTVLAEDIHRVSCPVKAGTLIVSRMNTPDLLGAAGFVAQDRNNLFLPDRLWQISFSTADARFIHFWTLTSLYRGQVKAVCTGTSPSMKNLGQDQFGSFSFATPPLSEQTQIAAFLDRETAKIDGLVAEQRRLMALLKEKRQAVISHAVTRGLNPDAPMKPSGIEWLGDVPAHWEVKRLKHISPFITVGVVVNPSTYVADDGHPFIYGGDIREGVIDWENSRRISSESSEVNSKTRLKAGDLLTVRVGAPGITAVVPIECEGGNCASVMLVRQGSFNSNWLCFAMNTRIVRFQVEVVQYGAAQEQFNISHAINFWTPTPPRIEQDEIAEFLAVKSKKFDTLTTEAQRAIDLLQERRTALISAAVTGQIDVRGFINQAELESV